VRPERLLVTRGAQGAWAIEHCLLSGACALVCGWVVQATMRELRRFALAAEKGAALGVLIRPLRAAQAHSAAVLRIALTAITGGLRVQLLKGRGVTPLTIEVAA
jgi:cell division inhibitor SulA